MSGEDIDRMTQKDEVIENNYRKEIKKLEQNIAAQRANFEGGNKFLHKEFAVFHAVEGVSKLHTSCPIHADHTRRT